MSLFRTGGLYDWIGKTDSLQGGHDQSPLCRADVLRYVY
jgi:hypothetical protein